MLITKNLPPRARLHDVVRHKVLLRLEDGAHKRLVCIKAPGGFGKTTLVNQWRQVLLQRHYKVGWLTLDATDNDVASFLSYWTAALHEAGCDEINSLPAVNQANQSAVLEAFLAEQINNLADLDEEVFLVLDDFHTVTNPIIHELLQQIVRYAPDNFHLMVLSRTAISLACHELRLSGAVTELGAKALRFTYEETAQVVGKTLGDASSEWTQALHEAAEGWPAGICLLAGQAEPHKHGSVMAQPLIAESLGGLPAHLESLVLRLSLLGRFNSAFCTEVLGVENADQVLEQLATQGVLLIPLDQDEGWYRCHTLFNEYLQKRLAEAMLEGMETLQHRMQDWFESTGEWGKPSFAGFLRECQSDMAALDIPTYLRKASAWFERRGLLDEAVNCALSIDQGEHAFELMDRGAMSLLASGDFNMVLVWADRLPAQQFALRSRMRLARFWAWTLGCHQDLARCDFETWDLSATERASAICPFEYQVCAAALAALGGDIRGALKLREHWPPSGDDFHNAVASNVLIYALGCVGQYEQIRAIALWQREKLPTIKGLTQAYQSSLNGWVHVLKGEFHTAKLRLTMALQQFEDDYGRRSTSACVVAGFLAELLYETDELPALDAVLAGRLDVINKKVIFESLVRAYLAGAKVCFLKGDDESAIALLYRLKAFGEVIRLHNPMVSALAEFIRMKLIRNRLIEAGEALREMTELIGMAGYTCAASERGANPDVCVQFGISKARYALAQGDPESALGELDKLVALNIEQRTDYFVRLTLLRCLALDHLNSPDAPIEMLRLLEAAEPSGFIRSFTDEGPRCRDLLTKTAALVDGRLQGYLERLLNSFSPGDRWTTVSVNAHCKLNRKELDILGLLSQGMPNKRIATGLSMSTETVKWHLKNIFAKLDVNNRVLAIDKARRAGLVV